jgi:hypothetical protein
MIMSTPFTQATAGTSRPARPARPAPPPAAVAALAAFAALLAVCASAPTSAYAQTASSTETILKDQPPMTEAEVPAVVEAIRFMNSPAAMDPRGPEALGELANRYGMTPQRLEYVRLKTSLGVTIIVAGGLTDEEIVSVAGTALARPTPEELEVIRAHMDEIRAAMLSGDQ